MDGAELVGDHSLGLISTNAATALSATNDPAAHADEFVQKLWDAEPQYGNYRYYDGLLQIMATLHVAGEFRVHEPEPVCSSTEGSCTDGQDDDCDGNIDCADSDCGADAACDVTCGNGTCGNAEDTCSCPNDCGAPPATELACDDGMDSDCDGQIDCADADCSADPACEVCGNNICANGEDVCSCASDCGAPPAEDCTNGTDDNCDGNVDCADAECSAEPACQGTVGSLALSPIFTSGMILQRGTDVPVFGTATPGAAVTVEFDGQVVVASADGNGDFQANLAAMSASAAPSAMTVSSGPDTIVVAGVQVGEVWLCSGQSNMGFELSQADNSASYVADAGNHNLSFFRMHNSDLPANASWVDSDSTSAADFSAVCYWMGLDLSQSLDVPIGLIQASVDGSAIEEWQHTDGDGINYDTMLKPLLPYAVKGVLWYQGESNGGDTSYQPKLEALLTEWRSDWGVLNLPFGIVQLPADKWEAARLAQFEVTRADANAFLIVTHDLPGGSQLHPSAKYEVGIRSSIGARSTVYGEAIEAGGPVPTGTSVSGDTMIVVFGQTGLGLATSDGGAPSPFKVASGNGRFISASAVISGNSVEASTSRVKSPVSVSYGSGNLVNMVSIPVEGGNTVTSLPASLFELP